MLTFRKLRGLYQFRRFMSKVVETKDDEGPLSWKTARGGLEGAETDEDAAPTSFIRNCFLGKFDTAILTFPEVLEKERHEWLHSTLAPIQTFFNNKVDSKVIDTEANVSEETLKGLKGFGLFGQEVPVEYGGLELNATEHARVTEVTGLNTSVGATLAYHQSFGIKGLLFFGTESQKKKYLPSLASGQHMAAFCLTEPSCGSDMASMNTSATLSTDGKSWLISGAKTMITNGEAADFFLVFAKTADNSVSLESPKLLTAFAVERKFGGITNGDVKDTFGARGLKVCDVFFDKTPVPMENVIGQVGEGFNMAAHILNTGRLSSACLAAGLLKKIIGITAQRAINRVQFGTSISEFQLIREKLARMTMSAYVVESLIYITTGLIDSKIYTDTVVETAILKVVSSEACWEGANECFQVFGGHGYMKDSPIESILRDSRLFMVTEQTNEILRLFISSMGIEHSGRALRDYVRKVRNPLQFPSLAVKKALERLRQQHSAIKSTLRLREYLHPSLLESSILLENSLERLKYSVELLLERHGAEIVNAQLELNRLAEITIDLYSMTAVLSRASRAYCIGLKNADVEISIADLFCVEAEERIKTRAQEIQDGEFMVPDNPLMRISDCVLTSKGYGIEHPLTRNFW